MARYVALLRAVSPMNCKMPELKRALEAAGFTAVKTVLSSGNAVFDTRMTSPDAIARRAEAAMEEHLGRRFDTYVRPQRALLSLLDSDPFARFKLPSSAKRVVTFLRSPPAKLALPIGLDGARILAVSGHEAFSAYEVSDEGPVFMRLIEKTFGKQVTTRTWDTVRKLSLA